MTTIEIYTICISVVIGVLSFVNALAKVVERKNNFFLNALFLYLAIITPIAICDSVYSRAAKKLKNKEITFDPEYYLEINNDSTVTIQNTESKTYHCPINKIDSVLIKDNL